MTTSRLFAQVALAGLIAAAALTATALPASAMIACNNSGECWHVRSNYVYRPEFGVTVHPDNWHWGKRERFRWRDHPGRGYWRNGVWFTF
jgi:hypothetical protein